MDHSQAKAHEGEHDLHGENLPIPAHCQGSDVHSPVIHQAKAGAEEDREEHE
jgi:hypothetical protein